MKQLETWQNNSCTYTHSSKKKDRLWNCSCVQSTAKINLCTEVSFMNGFLFTSKTTGVIAQTLLDFRCIQQWQHQAPSSFSLRYCCTKDAAFLQFWSPLYTLQGQMGIPNSSCLLPEPCIIHHN